MATDGERPLDDDERPAARRRRSDDDPPHYEEPHRGVLLLVLGILSIVACTVLGPIAWVMGNNDMRAIEEGRMDPEGKSLTQVGKILGMVGTGFLCLQFVFGILYAVGVAFFIANAPGPKPMPVNQPMPVTKPVIENKPRPAGDNDAAPR